MNRKFAVTVVLIIISAVLIIYRAETIHQHLEAGSKWARAFGNILALWFFGAIVAGIKELWARMKKRDHNFGGNFLWAVSILMALMVLTTAISSAKNEDNEQARDNAMLLMGASSWVPGVATYCNKYVEPNSGLLTAAQSWNQRHDSDLKKIIFVVEATGGMGKDEKRTIDQLAMRFLKQEIESQPDKKDYCKQVRAALEQGLLDLDQREDTAPAIKWIREYEVGK